MRAPKRRRSNGRKASTSRQARVPTSARRIPAWHSSTITIDLLDQGTDLGDVLLAQLAALGEMRDQRRDAAAIETIEQALAFDVHVVGALEQRSVQVAPAVAF